MADLRTPVEREHTLYVYEQLAEKNRLEEQTRREEERIRVEQERLRAAQENIKAEEERLKAEQAARDEQKRLREIAAQKVPPLTPLEARVPPQPSPTAVPAPTAQAQPAPPVQPPQQPTAQVKPAAPVVNGNTNPKPATSNLFSAPATTTTAPAQPTPAAVTPTRAPAAVSVDPKKQRAQEIHRNLKQLRAAIASQGDQNKPLKNKAGDLRRELRKSVGQLSMDKKGNQVVVSIA